MKSTLVLLLFISSTALLAQHNSLLAGIAAPVFKKDTFNIVRYGAIGNGQVLNTAAINKAIDACTKNGGGVVYLPAGLWLCGPIVLKSHVNLCLHTNATLLFTKDQSQYPLVKGNWEGLQQMRMQSPVSANDATDIAITGKGIIDGDGDGWRQVKKYQLTDNEWNKLLQSGVLSDDGQTWYPSPSFKEAAAMKNPGALSNGKDSTFYESIHDFLRPNLVVLTHCKNVLLDGVTLQNSAAWCLHPLMSENIILRNLFIKNPSFAHNGDAIDLESCKQVLMENCVLDVGDDALCMKSGRDKEGRQRAMSTENVTIRNCRVYAAHGGFVIGSEMSGGVKNVYVSNCTFIGTDIGLRFKSARGRGGVVENIFVDSIFMSNIRHEAILLDMFYMAIDPSLAAANSNMQTSIIADDETTPVFRNISISNVFCQGAEKAVFVRGLPEMPLNKVNFTNLVLTTRKGIEIQDANGLSFSNIQLNVKEAAPLVTINNSNELLFDHLVFANTTAPVFALGGNKTKQVQVKNTKAVDAAQKVVLTNGASADAISW